MCGIAGIYGNFKNQEITIRNITNKLKHRGPDSEGYYVNTTSGIALGHRRLSILDLSENGNQPFYSHCKRYVMVYNGEVFNYKEIASNLNINLKTNCDSEAIIEAFVLVGKQFVHQLNGMFAIVIYDTLKNSIYLFRDRLGIKPLFYLYNPSNNQFAFSSEIKSLKPLLSESQPDINQHSLAEFLHLGYISQSSTIYSDILKFPSGSYGVYHDNHLEIDSYWEPETHISTEVIKDEIEAKDRLSELLTDAVRMRMIADVPLGTFLSGGIDSSIVTAFAQRLSDLPIKTFSIGFKDNKYNESVFAKSVAKHLGTEHYEFILTEQDALDQITNLLDIYDEPFADSSAIPTLLVSRMARKEVTVALSGDGGDEQFMGYGMYDWSNRLSNPIINTFRKPLAYGLKTVGNNRLMRGAEVLNYYSKKNIESHIFSQEQYLFSERELNLILVNPPDELAIFKNFGKIPRKLTASEKQSFFDLKYYLKDDLLVKVDRASMFHSLEVRVPLLDHNLVEFTLNLDEKLKIKKGIKKYLLKQVLYDYVPESYFNRPKWGFSIPLERWLSTSLKYLLDEYLSKEVVEDCGIVNWEIVRDIKTQFFSGRVFLYNRLWALILIHKWIKAQ
ncbi:asparagine synthase (glutamine-hydrolyzing) [Fulvivirga lutea]|uniref:asparagine synthase (glutamine-hydrolyzing) n=1 Tax=Fulvivirga lutea TaxID=2810512 RepID=A0A974WIC6_9BACT|nr:asparagine synthase (glutamine-hydrolyzing) [Fulvivirga lutea]QSE98449.1 asparagine synthase (glutamine-hydrolyzing) [Fulvivirga lutea]